MLNWAKVKCVIGSLYFFISSLAAYSQQSYTAVYTIVGQKADSLSLPLPLEKNFTHIDSCKKYIEQLPGYLHSMGYIAASVDGVKYDSSKAYINLFLGDIYEYSPLFFSITAREILKSMGTAKWANTIRFGNLQKYFNQMLIHLQNNGYPFAKIYLDSISITKPGKLQATVQVNKGPAATFDSLQIEGNGVIGANFLYQYLGLRKNNPINMQKINEVSTRLKTLSFLEEIYPPRLNWESAHASLQLFVKKIPVNQVNVIVGFLPNASQSNKLQVSGEAYLNLKNEFAKGETILFNWQQLQKSSPRLKLFFDQPFIFNTAVGFYTSFDLYKKDTSYTNIGFQAGVSYILPQNKTAKIYIQKLTTRLNAINASNIISTRQLPADADINLNNLGLQFETNRTNSLKNPTKGWQAYINAAFGLKTIKKSNAILQLKDYNDPDYKFSSLYDTVSLHTYNIKIATALAQYIPVRKRNAFKLAVNAGLYLSKNKYRNELFQIGGFNLLRGFQEESQFLSSYLVSTVEYRYLIGTNAYFFLFSDMGLGKALWQAKNQIYKYLSGGGGLVFEKLGTGNFNITWALGARNDTGFNIKQSKIHLGYISYF